MVFVVLPVPRPVLRRVLLTALVAALSLAGCSDKEPGATGDPAAAEAMAIVGLVQNETFAPVAGAQVSLRMTDHVVTTDADGLFGFRDLPLSPYLVDVTATGFENATLNAQPAHNVSLSFVLLRPVPTIPEPVQLHYQGSFDCAFEAAIITPSCDTTLDLVREATPETPEAVPEQPDAFEDISTFEAPLGARWSTVVVDIDFESHPGLDGMRLTLQGKNDADQLGSYETYGQFHGAQPFTARVEPGQSYEGGDREVPLNATMMQFEVYPQSHFWHPAGAGVLGVGAGMDVQFDVYVTIFFVDPAPEGYSLLA
jgi:hypothetical protein